ncbi:MAG: GHKL domain-containing protein [Saprospiraceae bacterium]|nr:GHKL domain-containing protein [Saprospiraceae bacterium]HPG07825.1 ATP-binding protein [Saprospiraceae bacterium]
MRSNIHLTIGFLFLLHLSFGQNLEGVKHIERAKTGLKTAEEDTNKVFLYVDLCMAYQWYNEDSLRWYSDLGLKLAHKLNFPRGEIRLLVSQSISLNFKGDASKALQILFDALRKAEAFDLRQEQEICLMNIGAGYFFLNDLTKSQEYLRRAKVIEDSLSPATDDLYWKWYLYLWLGSNFSDLNQLDSASYFLSLAYEGVQSPEFIDKFNLVPTISMFYSELLGKKGENASALGLLKQSYANFNQFDDYIGLADASVFLARFYEKTDRPDSLLFYADIGLHAAQKSNYKVGIINAGKLLEKYYLNRDLNQAYRYLKLTSEVTDSLYGAAQIKELQRERTLLNEQMERQKQIEEETLKGNRRRQILFLIGLLTLLLITTILYRNGKKEKQAKQIIEKTLSDLKATQSQLIQSEKMASLGELTAGIAHEIQNPLNFVNNFSEVNTELLEELLGERTKEKGERDETVESELLQDIRENELKINLHGKRADAIVKSMLQHSRTSKGEKELTDINALCNEYLRLAFFGFKARNNGFEAKLKTEFDPELPPMNIVPQDIGRVLQNILNNAFSAVGAVKNPEVLVSTKLLDGRIEITITDNGPGIPDAIKDKIFQPFFTTKPTGQGTGLGLSLSYDIVKAHGGSIGVESHEGKGSIFTIHLPVS